MKNRFFYVGIFFALISFFSCSIKVQKNSVDYIQSENQSEKINLISENNFLQKMDSEVIPYLNEKMNSGFVNIDSQKKLYYESFLVPQNKGTIFIIHGYSEFTKKYDEITYYFLHQGFNVVRYDQRGHGFSFRDETDDLSKVYIKEFKTYVDDAKLIYDKIVFPLSNNKPIFLFAHSMGGAVGALLIEKYPLIFKAAIFNAPMFEINTGKVPSVIAKILSDTMCIFGLDRNYVLGHKEYEIKKEAQIGQNSVLSKNREQYILNIKNDNRFYQTNGATYSWLKTSFKATKKLLKKSETQKVKIPVLLFQADKDEFVKPKGQDKFKNQTEKTKIVFFPQTEHSIFYSNNKILTKYYNEIFDFIEENI